MKNSNFSKRLSELMRDLGLSQKDVCEMTGSSKSSVSQWLSGKNVPSDERQAEIAISLGFSESYFQTNENEKPKKGVPGMKISEAHKLLGISIPALKQGLQDGVFPWGYAVHMPSGKWVYWINKEKLMEEERI